MTPTRIAQAKRFVIKVGSALVTNNGEGLDLAAIDEWAKQIARLRQDGKEVVLVSSGAIACGMQRLGWSKRPSAVHELQACAAVGQMGLAQVYESAFAGYSMHTAQVLLTHDDLADRKRYLNARATLTTLLQLGVVPIINENDTVITDEIKFGDNDTLGALVANLVDADCLIILTDQQGLFTADPRKDASATLISEARAGDPALEAMAGGAGTQYGKGGMITKVIAAKRAASSGTHTVIASGREADVLVILTDQKGLYTADPRRDPNARFVDVAKAGDPALEVMAGGAGSSIGKGGMITKILAAKRAAGSGASTVIAWGREEDVLIRLSKGEAIGTLLVAQTQKTQARKQWMADHLQMRGSVTVDAGAAAKLQGSGKSLLPIGMIAVEGDFVRGDVIGIRDESGAEIARGLANYASMEARKLCRKPSSEFEKLLGYTAEPEMVHRDNLVLAHH